MSVELDPPVRDFAKGRPPLTGHRTAAAVRAGLAPAGAGAA